MKAKSGNALVGGPRAPASDVKHACSLRSAAPVFGSKRASIALLRCSGAILALALTLGSEAKAATSFESLTPSQRTSVNAAADRTFHAKHPELGGRDLDQRSKADAALRSEWMRIREAEMARMFPGREKKEESTRLPPKSSTPLKPDGVLPASAPIRALPGYQNVQSIPQLISLVQSDSRLSPRMKSLVVEYCQLAERLSKNTVNSDKEWNSIVSRMNSVAAEMQKEALSSPLSSRSPTSSPGLLGGELASPVSPGIQTPEISPGSVGAFQPPPGQVTGNSSLSASPRELLAEIDKKEGATRECG